MELGGVVLPAELERAVFEAAAVLDYRNISRLLLVAQRVHTWLKPFLYHVLVYRSPHQHGTDAHELFGTHVRHLMLFMDSSVADIAKLLAVCSAVQSLACYCRVNPLSLPPLALMRPLRLCIHAVDLFASAPRFSPDLFTDAPRFSHALFARTTHLQLLDFGFSALRALPCLTHLALDAYTAGPARALHELLRENTRLQAFVVTSPSDGTDWGAEYPTHDVRFVVAVVADEVADWVAGAWGHADFWARADDVIRLRRQASLNLLPTFPRRTRDDARVDSIALPPPPSQHPDSALRAPALRAANPPPKYFLRTRLSRSPPPPALSSSAHPRAPGARTNALCSPYRLLSRFACGRSLTQGDALVFVPQRWCEPHRSRVYMGAGSTALKARGGGEHVASADFALSMVSSGWTMHSSAGARLPRPLRMRSCTIRAPSPYAKSTYLFGALSASPAEYGPTRRGSALSGCAYELHPIRETPLVMIQTWHSGKPEGPSSHLSSLQRCPLRAGPLRGTFYGRRPPLDSPMNIRAFCLQYTESRLCDIVTIPLSPIYPQPLLSRQLWNALGDANFRCDVSMAVF
ncbi:hypothetical protein C8J57DRAFT_1721405 [Mycena rebaudengoi]|nr:hypothetical protein C8J57DRAFT_1721405 [Mycena rebaudengoi]